MLRQIKKARPYVGSILRHHKKTRDNDSLLYWRMMKIAGLEELIGPDNVKRVKSVMLSIPPPESLSRVRRQFQNDQGKYLGKKQRRKQRLEDAEEIRQAAARGDL